jgi:hypothetical protein|eukprot:SAG25_NODE_65_length_17663_cov_18.359656_6_plen_173_part_00
MAAPAMVAVEIGDAGAAELGGGGARRRAATRASAQLKQLEPEEIDGLRRFAHGLAQRHQNASARQPARGDGSSPAAPTSDSCGGGQLSAGRMLWIVHYVLLLLAAAAAFGCSVYLSFVLVPLAVAYCVTFLLSPFTELLTRRPLVCCGQEYAPAPASMLGCVHIHCARAGMA